MWYWRWASFSKAIQWSGPSEIGAARKWDSGFFGRCALRKTLRFCPWCSRILPLSRDCSSRFAGIMAADLGGYDSADGIASILIGLLLAVVAARRRSGITDTAERDLRNPRERDRARKADPENQRRP